MFKCDLFKSRVDYIDHDLTTLGKCPIQSKFQFTEQGPLPITDTSLLSFIALCTFYNYYYPWFETNIKLPRRHQRSFHHTSIPRMAWLPSRVNLFSQCKSNLLTSPLLLYYDSYKPVFLKTNYSATGMGYIVMQPDNSPASLLALQHLSKTGKCHFDLDLKGAILYPVAFGSRSNQTFEE